MKFYPSSFPGIANYTTTHPAYMSNKPKHKTVERHILCNKFYKPGPPNGKCPHCNKSIFKGI